MRVVELHRQQIDVSGGGGGLWLEDVDA